MTTRSTFAILFFLFSLISWVTSCDEKTDPIETPDESSYKVTAVSVEDVTNLGTPGDLIVTFTTPDKTDLVEGYRLLLFHASESNPDLLKSDATYQTIAEAGEPATEISVTVDATMRTYDDVELQEQVAYRAAIVALVASESIEFVQSDFSEEFELVTEATVSTLVESIAANDGLTVDAEGNIYASNYNGSQIVKVTQGGVLSTYSSAFNSPLDLLYQQDGSIAVIDNNTGSSGRISRVNSEGAATEIASISGWPSGLAQDEAGNLYVTNYLNPVINKISSDGTVSEWVSDSKLKGCVGVIYDPTSGNIYASNYDNGDVLEVTEDGSVTVIATISLPAGVSTNLGVTGYLTMLDGMLYVSGLGGHQIYQVTTAGVVTKVAGSTRGHMDGTASKAMFNIPNGIAAFGNKLFVLDYGQPSIRVIELN